MILDWTHAGPSIVAAFLASLAIGGCDKNMPGAVMALARPGAAPR